MNNDRELLELASRAAGYKITLGRNDSDSHVLKRDSFYMRNEHGIRNEWNSLTNDGDAFRLSIKLKIGSIWAMQEWGNVDFEQATEAYATDPYAATRRAITRAAAEIGKTL